MTRTSYLCYAIAALVIATALSADDQILDKEGEGKRYQTASLDGISIRAVVKRYDDRTFEVHVGLINSTNIAIEVVKGCRNVGKRIDNSSILLLSYEMFCGEEFEDEVLCKPSPSELNLVTLMPGESTHLSINRLVFSSAPEKPDRVVLAYEVDYQLKKVYPSVWCGEIGTDLTLP